MYNCRKDNPERIISKEGYQFEGFYIDGKKLGQEDADLDGNTVRIKVKGDTEVEARYRDMRYEL